MGSLLDFAPDEENNPVDVVEQVAHLRDWSFERNSDDELTLSHKGQWSDYHISFSWVPHEEALHVMCAFDLKKGEAREAEIYKLLALINTKLSFGHFDYWDHEGIYLYRLSHMMAHDSAIDPDQCARMIDVTSEACDHYYQAFQYVLWGGKTAQEAYTMSIFETMGHA